MLKKILILLLLVALAIHISGCGCSGCGCGGCCGSDDASSDTNSDSNNAQEQIPTTLGQTTSSSTANKVPSICDGVGSNSVTATASKSQTDSGYTYTYSYNIKACKNTIGYVVLLDGPMSKQADSGVASKGRETTGSNSYQDTRSYTQLCIKTGDTSIGNSGSYCVPFS